MFSILGRGGRLCDGISRREMLRIGGLHAAGLTLPGLLQARSVQAAPGEKRELHGPSFGRAKNIIYLWLQGGPPQHETFDPKPEAPREIRGSYRPIATNVPGIQFCELLPRTAAIADKLAIVRSLATNDDNHDVSGYWVLTGYPYGPGSARQIKPTDWPYFGSLVKMLKPSPQMPAFSSVWLPDIMRLNDNVQPAGQTGGFLGPQWDPERLVCDPSQPGFQVEAYHLPRDVPPLRMSQRRALLQQVEQHFALLDRSGQAHTFDYYTQEALSLISSGRARKAFDLDQEPAPLRDRYGRSKWGQSVLLARRLIEAGVRLVHVNWTREDGDTAIDNPMWDTHAQNDDRVKEVLCPQFDVTFTMLIDDLEQRGLLSETLVVAIGEFGRTPKINGNGGRDHWGRVFSFALAGAGIAGGQVYGATDKTGGYPIANRVEPQELTATLFHLLGVDHSSMFHDKQGRLLRLTKGEPLFKLLGDQPATAERVPAEVDTTQLTLYDPQPLILGDFEMPGSLTQAGSPQSQRGWQAEPLYDERQPAAFSVRLVRDEPSLSRSGAHHVTIGYGRPGGAGAGVVPAGARYLLTQKLSAPRVGKYTLSVHVAAQGASAEVYRDVWQKHLRTRLMIFGYTDLAKNPHKVREFASTIISPTFSPSDKPDYQKFETSAYLRSQDGGAMETSKGVGVALVVEKITPGELDLANVPSFFLRVDDVQLAFDPRPRNDDVRV